MEQGRIGKTIRGKTGVRQLYKSFKDRDLRDIRLSVFMQDWDDPYNVGGMFRVADALGVKELFASGKTPLPPHPQIHVTSMGHHRRIEVHSFEKHEEAALAAKARGYSLIALELAEGAVCYTDYEWPDAVCLVLGSETGGTYGSVMKHRDGAVYVPQFGKGRSMNVHVTAAVVGFHVREIGAAKPLG